ncbi:aldolase [Thozetella sp. PMI_491]|nr:aldolase [Thozetella sp. PMI_491]
MPISLSPTSRRALARFPVEPLDYLRRRNKEMTNTSLYSNGHAPSRPLTRGVYVPTVAFFEEETENLDLNAIAKHAVRIAESGVAGIAVQGSNGEAVHLTHEERRVVIQTTRLALNGAGFQKMPLIVGCGAQSTRETILLCRDARESGGDYALVLPPSYYSGLFSPTTIYDFFTAVADASPVPIILYNYPGGASGVDLSSDHIISLGKHPNIVGCKFTCGNTGKLGRVAAAFKTEGMGLSSKFVCFAGSGDFTLPALSVGGVGIIGGIANVAPKACVRLFDLHWNEQDAEAAELQDVIARGDWAAIQAGVVGVKVALNEFFGYGGAARKPLPSPTGSQRERIVEGFQELVKLEKSL